METMLQGLTAWPAPKVPAFLTQGAPHPQSAEIDKILGVPLTTEGVGNFFAAALPGSVAAPMLKCYPEKNQVFMSVELRSAEGQKAANFMTVLTRKPDGSLELMRGMEDVEPEFRGRGITDRIGLSEISLVKGLSDHPESCVNLRAAGFTPGREERQFGTYVWARTGLFECDPKEWQGLKSGFETWLGQQPLSPEQRTAALEASQEWTCPYDIATAKLPGLSLPVTLEGKTSQVGLGKAYLLSETAPAWHGTCRVNQPASPQTQAGLTKLKTNLLEGVAPPSPEERRRLSSRMLAQFCNTTLTPQERTEKLVVGARVGQNLPDPILQMALADPDDRVRLGAASVSFEMAHLNREGALKAAWSLLENPPGASDRPIFWSRMGRVDALRVVARLEPGAVERLKSLQPADCYIQSVIQETVNSLVSGVPQGILACDDYPEAIRQP